MLEIQQSRIAEALRQPVESPDIADSVMTRLRRYRGRLFGRRVWAYAAAACLVVAITLVILCRAPHPGRIAEHTPPVQRVTQQPPSGTQQDQHVPATTKPTPTQPETAKRLAPVKSLHSPKVPTRRTGGKSPNTAAVKPSGSGTGQSPERPESAPPDRQEVAQDTGPSDDAGITVAAELTKLALDQIKPIVYVLPPNKDAETIERPPLELIENRGPVQVRLKKLGG